MTKSISPARTPIKSPDIAFSPLSNAKGILREFVMSERSESTPEMKQYETPKPKKLPSRPKVS